MEPKYFTDCQDTNGQAFQQSKINEQQQQKKIYKKENSQSLNFNNQKQKNKNKQTQKNFFSPKWINKHFISRLQHSPQIMKSVFYNHYNHLFLSYGQYERFVYYEIFRKAEVCSLDGISICRTKRDGILKDIKNIEFKSLTYLCLSENHINNIQAISFIDAPEIKQLNIDNNYVTSIKPLIRTKFKKLSKLFLSGNPIKDLSISLPRMLLFPDSKETISLSIRQQGTYNRGLVKRSNIIPYKQKKQRDNQDSNSSEQPEIFYQHPKNSLSHKNLYPEMFPLDGASPAYLLKLSAKKIDYLVNFTSLSKQKQKSSGFVNYCNEKINKVIYKKYRYVMYCRWQSSFENSQDDSSNQQNPQLIATQQ